MGTIACPVSPPVGEEGCFGGGPSGGGVSVLSVKRAFLKAWERLVYKLRTQLIIGTIYCGTVAFIIPSVEDYGNYYGLFF